jgi:hypothetical protein
MKKILLQLDVDPQPCSFDAIVAIDAGADILLRHGDVSPDNVVSLIHGAMFTRGASDLSSTSISLGGKNIPQVEAIASQISKTFFKSVRVSVFIDPAGANTTAAATVLAAKRHISFKTSSGGKACHALVLGGTGPVGQRVSQLLANQGIHVHLASRSFERASQHCNLLNEKFPHAHLEPTSADRLEKVIGSTNLIISAGGPGVELLTKAQFLQATAASVCIDLNAVPPAGLSGIHANDTARRDGTKILYGALGIGGIKMKIHKAAIQRLFQTNDLWLDAEELLTIGEEVDASNEQTNQ